jgi:hypothetical protein
MIPGSNMAMYEIPCSTTIKLRFIDSRLLQQLPAEQKAAHKGIGETRTPKVKKGL